MSKKPTKRSDIDKPWIKERKDKIIKSKLEYHLIICEGTKTEPNYFNGIKGNITERNREKLTIEIIGKGVGTTYLLKEAIKKVQHSTNFISNVWLIYDKDEFTDESFNKVVDECIKINKDNNTVYHPIWSNESIETWFLLHFIRFDTPMGRRDCIKKINENFERRGLGKYKKNDCEIYNKLKQYVNIAIGNAKWQVSQYDKNENPSEMNPSTRVYELVELLNKYIS